MHPGNTLEIRVVDRCAGADRGESSKCLKLTYHKIHTSIHLLPFSDIVPTDPSLCAPTDRVENITKYVVWQWCDWTNVDGRVPTEVMSMPLLMGLGQKAAFSMFVGIRAWNLSARCDPTRKEWKTYVTSLLGRDGARGDRRLWWWRGKRDLWWTRSTMWQGASKILIYDMMLFLSIEMAGRLTHTLTTNICISWPI